MNENEINQAKKPQPETILPHPNEIEPEPTIEDFYNLKDKYQKLEQELEKYRKFYQLYNFATSTLGTIEAALNQFTAGINVR